MLCEVQWNVERRQKLHLDWMGFTRPVGSMDEKTLDEINQRFAAIAMQMEDMLSELLEPVRSHQEVKSTLKELSGLMGAIGIQRTEIQKLIGPSP